MACRLVGAKPLSEPVLEYCYFTPQEQISVERHLRNGGIFSQPQCVNKWRPEQNGYHYADVFQMHFLEKKKNHILIKFSQKFVFEEPIGPELLQTCWIVMVNTCMLMYTNRFYRISSRKGNMRNFYICVWLCWEGQLTGIGFEALLKLMDCYVNLGYKKCLKQQF